MGGREINARQVLEDIRDGMGPKSLMEKYKLTPLGLHNLFEELTNLGLVERASRHEILGDRQRISIREIVKDIKSGMSDPELMAKYRVGRNTLQSLFKKLLELKAVSRDLLFGQLGLNYDTSIPSHVRELHRYILDFDIPVYEEGLPEIQGRVHDITQRGIGIRGLHFEVNQIRTLIVLGDAFGVVAPFEFQAMCRWSGIDEDEGQEAAGFQILDISTQGLEEIEKLIKLITFG